MTKTFIKYIATFLAATLAFILGKIIFLAGNFSLFEEIGIKDFLAIIGHGLSMDFSMAGYLTVIPSILLIAAICVGLKGTVTRIFKIYFAFASLLVSLIIVLDTVLYGYWQFKLDSTPLFYFFSSPSAAFASAEWWQYLAGPVLWLLLAAVYYAIFYFAAIRLCGDIRPYRGPRKTLPVFAMLLLTALLFIPIRGGVTVSTMNLSRAYFSPDTRLNHAAVNPAFSLMYSLSHQNDFGNQYRFMDAEKAAELFATLTDAEFTKTNVSDSIQEALTDSIKALSLLSNTRPDIYIILLESFSSHLFPSLGGEDVALHLDKIAQDGLLFTNFYANSFRTDRGIPSVLSAYPGQPSTSIMKFVEKTENLPSLPMTLKRDAGYTNSYFYGGDANFTNMNAYLVSAGFGEIISDKDFPISQKLSKWGAHDEVVFEKALADIKPYDSKNPRLRVIQTSSSHEPFEVPYDARGRLADQRAVAFAYADSCAASFVNSLKESPEWKNSLVVLVPDHYGAYPDLTDPIERHKIPLILTGGALQRKGRIDTVGSQIDITATLLSAMGLDHKEFRFSKNILNPKSPHFAFFADPSLIGFVTDSDRTVFNLDTSEKESGKDTDMDKAKAFLQTLYDDLATR